MNEKVLIVVDMQNDFITGKLGTVEAREIALPNIVKKLDEHSHEYCKIYVTKDVHYGRNIESHYIEGQRIPEHCLYKTEGSELNVEIMMALNRIPKLRYHIWEKNTFVDDDLIYNIRDFRHSHCDFSDIEICGVCTDICVISHALALRSALPTVKITVDTKCCAGTTLENHDAALAVMRSCLIDVV